MIASNGCRHRTGPVEPNHRSKPSEPTPGEIARAITGRDYLSFSQISTYQSCPLKFWFTYVEQAKPERISAAMLMGSSIHAAIQRHLEARLAAEPHPTIEELMRVYRDSWETEAGQVPVQFSREDTTESLSQTAQQMLEAFLDSPYSKSEGKTIGIEEELRVKLAADLPDLLGRIDKIELKGDELIITDYKTARSMWNSVTADDHGEQLVLYGQAAATIAKDLNANVRLQFVVLTKAKTPKVDSFDISIKPGGIQASTKIMRQVFRSMQLGVVYPSPNPINCSTCPYRNRCNVWSESPQG